MRRTLWCECLAAMALAACAHDGGPGVGRELGLEDDAVEGDGVVHGIGELGWAVPEEEVLARAGAREAEDLAPERPVDVDRDGVPAQNDCDDLDPTVSPLAQEIRCNNSDENCNGVDDCDRDGDGFRDVDDPEPDVPAGAPLRLPDGPRWP